MSKTHPLTQKMLTKHIAVMGKTGSGKTFAAKGAVEALLASGAQVVILDPTSAWWGLRVKPDGKSTAFDRVVVLGGRHADLALSADPLQAAALAEAVCSQGLSCVLDTGDMTVGERTRWSAKFAETLYRKVQQPLHLVIDEAHEFAPQASNPSPEANIMLHAFKQIASGGRSRGLRLLLITQRPAKLHKDVLTSCDTIVAMRVIAPQDRKAIQEWVEGCGDPAKAREVLGTLAIMPVGEGWLWCPEIDPDPKRVCFPAIKTYDSSATPEGGAFRQVKMGEVDTDALGKLLAAAGEKIKSEDPKTLQRRIKELEAAARNAPVGAGKAELVAEYQRGFSEGQLSVTASLGLAIEQARAAVEKKLAVVDLLPGEVDKLLTDLRDGATKTKVVVNTPARTPRIVGGTMTATPPVVTQVSGAAPNGSQAKILNAICWYESFAGNQTPSREAVAFMAEMKPTGGHYANVVSSCKSAGWVEYPRSGELALTAEGRARAVCPTTASALAAVRAVVDGSQWKIVEALDAAGGPLTRSELAQAAGMDAGGGHFANVVSSLRTAGVLEYPAQGTVELCGWVRSNS